MSTHAQPAQITEAISQPLSFVKWGAEWCGPCKKIQPTWETLAAQHAPVPFFTFDVDEFEEDEAIAHISSLPRFECYHNRRCVSAFVGADAYKLQEWLKAQCENQS